MLNYPSMEHKNFDIISKEELNKIKKILLNKGMKNFSTYEDLDHLSKYCLEEETKYSNHFKNKIKDIKKDPSINNLKKLDNLYNLVKKKPNGYWSNLENTLYESKKIIKKYNIDHLPSSIILNKLGHDSLADYINKNKGGINNFRKLINGEEPKKNKLKNKIDEIYTLKNKIDRYSKRLIFEGFNIASKNSLEIKLKQVSKDYFDTEPLINLTQKKFSSLFRKYNSLKNKYFENLKELKEM